MENKLIVLFHIRAGVFVFAKRLCG